MFYSSQIHSQTKSSEQEYLAGWQRARAELENLRKRYEQERLTYSDRAKKEMIQPMLSLADNFEALAAHVPEDLAGNSWSQGVLHVSRQFRSLLAELGVEEINPAGADFDPALHEAVEQEKSKIPTGKITEVLQLGYKINGLVVRPARVRVAA